MGKELWKVGDLARRTGLSIRTLHYYDEIGLLSPSHRTGSGHRLYDVDDVARLQRILSLRQLGFSLEEVKDAWAALLPEIQANRDLDPASPQAQALAQRWDELTERTMRGYQAFPELKQAIGDNYKQGKFEGHAHAPQA